MTTTSDKILQKIKDAKIAPEPKWKFSAINSAEWVMFFAAILIGSLSFAVMIDMLVGHDWDLYPYLHKSFLQYLFLSLPYVWIVCVGLFSWIAYYNFVHTKGWYKHRLYLVVLASIFLSVFLGTCFFFLGFGRKVDEVLSSDVPYYNMMKLNKKAIWNHPDEGLLGGTVTGIKSQNELILSDDNGQDWDVEAANVYKDMPDMAIGERIKVIGVEKDSHIFMAKEIRDWESSKEIKHEDAEKKDAGGGVCTTPEVPCSGQ